MRDEQSTASAWAVRVLGVVWRVLTGDSSAEKRRDFRRVVIERAALVLQGLTPLFQQCVLSTTATGDDRWRPSGGSGAVKRQDFAPTARRLAWLGALVHDCLQRVKEPVEGALQREHHLVHHLMTSRANDGRPRRFSASSRLEVGPGGMAHSREAIALD